MMKENKLYIAICICVIFVNLVSCSNQIRLGLYAWNNCNGEWGASQAQSYFLLPDSVMISSQGIPLLCISQTDSIKVLKDIWREGRSCDNPNAIDMSFNFDPIVESLSLTHPYNMQKCIRIFKISTTSDTCKTALKDLQILSKGVFEFSGAEEIYAKLGNPNSLGIFTTTSRNYRKYRMINGIQGDSVNLRKTRASFLFTASDLGAGRESHYEDSVYPLLIYGYLPEGLSKLTQTSWSDYIFKYKSGASVWIHLRPMVSISNINHPINMQKHQALELLRTEFPFSSRFGYISDVKTILSNIEAKYNIYLYTSRCIIFASCNNLKEYKLFYSFLKETFVEKDAKAMNMFYKLACKYDVSVWNYLPELAYSLYSNAEYYKMIIKDGKNK